MFSAEHDNIYLIEFMNYLYHVSVTVRHVHNTLIIKPKKHTTQFIALYYMYYATARDIGGGGAMSVFVYAKTAIHL